MKRIEFEQWAGGILVRRFTDKCEVPDCLQKHWILERQPIEKCNPEKELKEWLDET